MFKQVLLAISKLILLAALVSAVAPSRLYAQATQYTFAGVADWDADGHQDIVARDSAGLLWLYPGDSSRGYSQSDRVQIGNGWKGFTFAGVADWDADGNQDIVARDSAGLLWLYPGDSSRGYSQSERVQIGNGWKGFTSAGVADWDADGHQDIIARDSAGLLWLYPGDSSQGYSQFERVQIGNGWKGFTSAGVADWDADGNQDIVARDSAGLLWLYPGDSSRGYSQFERVQIGNGWKGYTAAGLADWDSDGHQDIVARDAKGLLWLYPGDSSQGYSQFDRVQIGNGW